MLDRRRRLPRLLPPVFLVVLAGCSLFNRDGPDVTCGDLENGQRNACTAGIIASCADGYEVTYVACAAEEVCDASWQVPGAYNCSRSSSGGTGTGGTGGAGGGTSGTAEIVVALAALTFDSGQDGSLNPGETAKVEVFAKNTGTVTALGVAAGLSVVDPNVQVTGCRAYGTGAGSTGWSCGAPCDCSNATISARQDLDPGATGEQPILTIDMQLADLASPQQITFGVVFQSLTSHLELGDSWSDSFEIPVVSP